MVGSVIVASVDGAAVGGSGELNGASAAVGAVSDTGGEETLPAGGVGAGAAGALTSRSVGAPSVCAGSTGAPSAWPAPAGMPSLWTDSVGAPSAWAGSVMTLTAGSAGRDPS